MKTINKIPVGKLGRTSKLVQTGAKVGRNYLKYYGEKAFNRELGREKLDENNASDIYDGLKNLKGSALKMAQMLSMEKSLLPKAYIDKFSLAQFSVPPLSAPLVRKTFKKYQGAYPEEIYDYFETDSINAASIGQVHRAEKYGKKLAVKIQYPGVAESIGSDLAMVKPIAIKMFNLQGKDSQKYFKEIESKLLEETDYVLEVEQSTLISEACKHIPHLKFPNYYKELSNERIITMDWMEGLHLSDFVKTNFSKETANSLGQALWDFYMFQIHQLKMVQADPHPGNFLVDKGRNLIAIDFGCIKKVPDEFYVPYFELAKSGNLNDSEFFTKKLYELELLREDDGPKEIEYFYNLFHEMLAVSMSPLQSEVFDFSDGAFLEKLAELSEKYSKDRELRKMNGSRGSKHFLYFSRTFFGLYNLLNDLKAEVKINSNFGFKP